MGKPAPGSDEVIAAQQQKDKDKYEQQKAANKKRNQNLRSKTFTELFNILVVFILTGWETLTKTIESIQSSINISQHATDLLGKWFATSDVIEQNEHNIKVIVPIITSALMAPLYMWTGITGVFIYSTAGTVDKTRGLDTENSATRDWIQNSKLMNNKYFNMVFKYIVYPFQKVDDSKFGRGILYKNITDYPYVFIYFISILIIMLMFPSLQPTLFFYLVILAYICYKIFQSCYGFLVAPNIVANFPNVEKSPEQVVESDDFVSANMPLYVKVAYVFSQILLGLLSLVPAARLCSLYVWIMSIFTFNVAASYKKAQVGTTYVSPFKQVVKNMAENAKNKPGLLGAVLTILNYNKCLCIALLISLMSIIALFSVVINDSAFASMAAAGIVVYTCVCGVFADVILLLIYRGLNVKKSKTI